MNKLIEVKVLLMREVKDSDLPKSEKLELLEIVKDKDIFVSLDLLESYKVISEVDKEEIKAWLKKHGWKIPVGVAAGVGAYYGGKGLHKHFKEKRHKARIDKIVKGTPTKPGPKVWSHPVPGENFKSYLNRVGKVKTTVVELKLLK